ncbi:zinc-dependent alcohol dehydrogenase [Actinokineospora iranica]|uniref:2-desacetyl-2-hydroxyethyl bacteriochlorophyllide A dehydrogenase n=1 Tax=Actinokineospora iranica TaxID=1271860 RepID=A0A1G6UAF1_9PSEU|nr:alcohol dehydrogenase catalytic domain-containing protein [Actinokineospora iranica]SDD38204.1 2-desacetyl-2-hydroxyethyl bacteriochlorophyllide A dehydrogenase [Actinokineospora iranica]
MMYTENPVAEASTMLAVVVTGPGEHSLERVPRPSPEPDEALVAVSHVALCGTDLRLLRGTLHDAEYPVIPGHEWAGVVLAAPSRPDLVGQAVVGHNFKSCGACGWCERGAANLCPTLDEVGFTLPGAFAEAFCLPVQNLRPLPAGLSGAEGCLLEPLCVAIHAAERAGEVTGRTVGVIGAGTVGLLVAQLAVAGGATSVTVADPAAQRRGIAAELGLGAVADLTVWHDDPREVVVDATGVAGVFPAGLVATAQGGRYVLVGYSGEDSTPFEPSLVMLRELTVVGSLSGVGRLDRALEVVADGSVRLGPLLSDALPLADYRAVLDIPADSAPLRNIFSVNQEPSQ